jgi:hypothetical protein
MISPISLADPMNGRLRIRSRSKFFVLLAYQAFPDLGESGESDALKFYDFAGAKVAINFKRISRRQQKCTCSHNFFIIFWKSSSARLNR